MPAATRSATTGNNLAFTASKPSSSKAVTKSKSKSTPAAGSLEASIALFRSEGLALLSAPPPVPSYIDLRPADQVQVLAAIERVTSRGLQQSVQLCQISGTGGSQGESWVTRTEGGRSYFPRVAQIKKRMRAVREDADEEDGDEEDGDEEEEQREREQAEERTPFGSAKKKARTSTASASSSRKDKAPDAPRKPTRASASSPSTSRHRSRRNPADRDDPASDDEDDGATTATEESHLAQRHGGTRRVAPLGSASGSGSRVRRSARHRSKEHEARRVKQEETDELASLCGGIDGMGVRSTVEPDTDHEMPPTAFASTSTSASTSSPSTAFSFSTDFPRRTASPAAGEGDEATTDAGKADRKGKGRAAA
ncbi:hypothetical protein JCM10207_001268 [Rhodosporidiobolus poonsookiae]